MNPCNVNNLTMPVGAFWERYAAELKENFVTVTLPDDFFDEGADPEP